MASYIFLSIPGLSGSSTVPGFVGQYPVSSFSQMATQQLSAGSTSTNGSGAGKVTFDDLTITISNDYTIPDLFLALCSASDLSVESSKPGNFVVISIVETSPNGTLWTPMTLTMDLVVLQSLNITSDYQNVTLLLSYGKLSIRTWQGSQGAVVSPGRQQGWNRIRNKFWDGVTPG